MKRKEIEMKGFSERIIFPDIPEGPGICLIEDEAGNVLQVAASNNVRRRIGEMFDSQGTICVHGPKIYATQRHGDRIYVRWKITPDYKAEKQRLVEELALEWKK